MKALITGVTGQDGSYLSDHLLNLGYEVFGTYRRVAIEDPSTLLNRVDKRVKLIECDINNFGSCYLAVQKAQPDEIYHLAAQSFVAHSFRDSFETINTNVNGTLNMLESFKALNKGKFYFAGSSEQYGHPDEIPMNENTRFHPRSPYAVSKVAGFHLVQNFREAYKLFAASGILFNHESPRRGKEFVTRKITRGIADIVNGRGKTIQLGNIDAKRDWGFAGDYVKAMHLILQQDKPSDYVIATGETHTIREFLDIAFDYVGIKDWSKYVETNKAFMRPSDVELLLGDAKKAEKELGWKPVVKFKGLVEMMMEADLREVLPNCKNCQK